MTSKSVANLFFLYHVCIPVHLLLDLGECSFHLSQKTLMRMRSIAMYIIQMEKIILSTNRSRTWCIGNKVTKHCPPHWLIVHHFRNICNCDEATYPSGKKSHVCNICNSDFPHSCIFSTYSCSFLVH